ncbi:MAG: hypothetical protein KAR20_09125 [Candidatus Heimdallarchaeota archaeon]|nr:hypothetical protein [Candidatus Heimdallarchaeota archaeon]
MSKNISVDVKDGSVTFKVNPNVYPMGVIFQAADVFIEKAYVYVDGDPEKEISVTLKPKDDKANVEDYAGEFNNELVNYAAYFVRSQVNRDVREAMLKRAFFSVSPNNNSENKDEKEFESKKLEKIKIDIGSKVPIMDDIGDDDSSLEDIAKPWAEQKGKIDNC